MTSVFKLLPRIRSCCSYTHILRGGWGVSVCVWMFVSSLRYSLQMLHIKDNSGLLEPGTLELVILENLQLLFDAIKSFYSTKGYQMASVLNRNTNSGFILTPKYVMCACSDIWMPQVNHNSRTLYSVYTCSVARHCIM